MSLNSNLITSASTPGQPLRTGQTFAAGNPSEVIAASSASATYKKIADKLSAQNNNQKIAVALTSPYSTAKGLIQGAIENSSNQNDRKIYQQILLAVENGDILTAAALLVNKTREDNTEAASLSKYMTESQREESERLSKESIYLISKLETLIKDLTDALAAKENSSSQFKLFGTEHQNPLALLDDKRQQGNVLNIFDKLVNNIGRQEIGNRERSLAFETTIGRIRDVIKQAELLGVGGNFYAALAEKFSIFSEKSNEEMARNA